MMSDEKPTGMYPAGFLLFGFSFCGILYQERNGSQGIPSSEYEGIYYYK
jgi:hypothetical protein